MKILIFILLLPVSLFSQSGFNRIYATDSTKVDFTHIVADNDTLFVVGMEKSFTASKWDLLIAKIDTFGNYIQKIRRTSDLGYLTGDTKAIKTSDNGYLIHSSYGGTKGFALKLNHDLEEEFLTELNDSINNAVLNGEIVEVADGYIIGGYVQMSTWDSQAWAMKLDYEGNEIWHHRYGAADTSEFVYAMEVMADESVLLTGIKNNFNETNPDVVIWAKPWSIKINVNNGEVIWEKNYESDSDERSSYAVHALSDGSFLTGGAQNVMDTTFFYGKLSIRRLDDEGNLIWKKFYGPKISPNVDYFYGILPLPDGRFVAIGRGKTAAPLSEHGFVRAAITICFNPENGEEYWTRIDTIPIDIINNENNYVQGGTVLSSGSIVVAGYSKNSGRSYGWLLKMDKNGCIQDDCETYTAVEDVREVVALPVLFPNPAESYFRIKGEHEGGIGIYSVSGRLVKAVAENLTFGEIGVGDLPKGLYFVRGQSGGRVWVLKLVR